MGTHLLSFFAVSCPRPISMGFLLWYFVALLFLLIPPINDPLRFSFLFLALLPLCFSQRQDDWRRIGALTFLVVVLFFLRVALPVGEVAEKHHLFLTKGDSQTESWAKVLPAPVLKDFADTFHRVYPPQKQCDEKSYGCWRHFNLTAQPVAWSADNIWRAAPDVTRMSREINVHDIISAKLGVFNTLNYNWYNELHDKPLSDIHRQTAPFWVNYTLPAEAAGGQLCWRGEAWWQKALDVPVKKTHDTFSCVDLVEEDSGSKIWMGFIDSEAGTKIKLTWPASQNWLRFVDFGLAGFGTLFLVLFSLRPRKRELALGASLTALAALVFYHYSGEMLTGLIPCGGGGDGLGHSGNGRLIARALIEGNWLEALRGGEDVFYYMPGLRYFIALEHFIFGEMHYGEVISVLLFPVLVWRLFRHLKIEIWTVPVLAISLFLPHIARAFGISYRFYAEQAGEAMAEPQGYILWLTGLLLVMRGFQKLSKPALANWLLVGLLWAAATFMRPNLSVASGLGVVFCALLLLRSKNLKSAIALCFGFSFIGFCLVHNLYFAEKWVVLTSAAMHPANLLMPPENYLKAATEIAQGAFSGEHVVAVKDHLVKWLGGAKTGVAHAIMMLGIVALMKMKWKQWRLDLSAWFLVVMAVGLHAPLFFFHPSGRYAYLAWMITLLIFLRLLGSTDVWKNLEGRARCLISRQ